MRAPSIGTSVRATSNDAINGNVIANASSRMMSWNSLWMKTTGMNTATVVVVEAIMARLTSAVPARAASMASLPASKCLKMDSITTMPLSASIPIDNAKPHSDSTLSDRSQAYMRLKVSRRDEGIANNKIPTNRALRRNKNSTPSPRNTPMTAARWSVPRASCMISAWSSVTVISISSAANCRLSLSTVTSRFSAMEIRLPSFSFWMRMLTDSRPLTRL